MEAERQLLLKHPMLAGFEPLRTPFVQKMKFPLLGQILGGIVTLLALAVLYLITKHDMTDTAHRVFYFLVAIVTLVFGAGIMSVLGRTFMLVRDSVG